jgi:hypothetical protein
MIETQSHRGHRDQTVFVEITINRVRRFDFAVRLLSRTVGPNDQDESTSL